MDADYEEDYTSKPNKQSNVLPLWGNERTMNLNPLILTNIQSSHYFKVNLYELKTYHEVVDEIYYQVSHLEPWEKGSRRTSGQTGMCGGVRGVGAGGIVSTAYCLLYKLFTLKLTRKQLNGLLTHCDSPYIRALGFMYIRYTQHPQNLLDWFDPYLEDEEEIDVKAGGGQVMTIGTMLRQWLVKLEWYSTLFPRIPVPIQQRLQKHLQQRFPSGVMAQSSTTVRTEPEKPAPRASETVRDRDWEQRDGRHRNKEFEKEHRHRDKEYDQHDRYRDKERYREHDNRMSRDYERPSRDYERLSRDKERDRLSVRDYDRHRERDRSRERERDRNSLRDRHSSGGSKHRDKHRHESREYNKNASSRERDREYYSSKSKSRR